MSPQVVHDTVEHPFRNLARVQLFGETGGSSKQARISPFDLIEQVLVLGVAQGEIQDDAGCNVTLGLMFHHRYHPLLIIIIVIFIVIPAAISPLFLLLLLRLLMPFRE